MMLVVLIELLITAKLIIFHIYLKIKGISTFEYIKRKDASYKSRFVIRTANSDRKI